MQQLLQSTAATVVGRGYLSADHISTATGLDPAITISKNGGNFANPAAGASVMTEIEATGWYKFALGTADADTIGPLIIRGTHATMDNIEVVFQVIAVSVAQTGDAYAVVAHTDYGNAKLVRSTTPANTLSVDTSHRALSDLASILGTALTETTPGWIAAAVKKLFNVATPTGTINSLPDAVPGASGGLPVLGSNAAGMTINGQVKISADVAGEGALHVVNANATGKGSVSQGKSVGAYHYGDGTFGIGELNAGNFAGQQNYGGDYGQYNQGTQATYNKGSSIGVLNAGETPVYPQPALASDMTTLLNRLGAWAGTGVNTILGAFKALLSKDATAPSDIGGTFSPATDSTEAIRDAMALEATLTAIKGAGWSTETLAAIDVLIDAIKAKTDLITPDTALTVVSPVDGGDITIAVTASFAGTVSGLTIPSTWTKLWFSVKAKRSDADAAAKLQLVVSNPAVVATDGVLYVASGTATSAQRTKGSLTVSQAAGTVAIALDETLTAVLTKASGLEWDIKCLESGGACTVLTEGDAVIGLTVTRALV